MSKARELVFNSVIVLRIVRELNHQDGKRFLFYLKLCRLDRYEKEISGIVKEKYYEEIDEYYRIRRTITNEDVGCATS